MYTYTRSRPPSFTRQTTIGWFDDIPSDIEVIICGFCFHLRTEELLQYSKGMFSRPPDISDTEYIGRVNDGGNWLFFPLDDACEPIPPEWQIPDSRYKSQYIDTFTAFVNVIYDRYADFQSMGHVRGVFRMCKFSGALSRFSEYMNFRFLDEHGQLLSTLDKDPIANLNMAEEIQHRVLYSQCFTLLTGRVAKGYHQNLIGLNSVVSIHTQRQLTAAHRRMTEKYKSIEGKVHLLIKKYKTLLFHDGDVVPDPVLDRYRDLRKDIQPNRHRSPEDYKKLREIIDDIGETHVFQESAWEGLRAELSTCKSEIDELLENRLLYHPTERIDFFACLTMSEYPWLLDC